MEIYWKSHVEEGKKLYDYLITNFHDMFDGDIIKHFNFRYVSPLNIPYINEIKDKYLNIIQPELIFWIKNEFNDNCIFDNNNWKPFRDRYEIDLMYLGYKKLFQYKQYYFQLAIESDILDDRVDCKYCKKGDSLIHFELALYGWKDEKNDKIQPYNEFIINLDCMMPEKDWNNNN
jgi:hypothetical protein